MRHVVVKNRFIALTLLCLVAITANAHAQKGIAIHVGKVITCAGDPIPNGTILIRNGKIQAVGPKAKIKVPAGYQIIDHSNQFAMPGLIDAHSHVGGTMDLNEMVYQTNPELRNWDQIIPHNARLKVAIAGGVTW